MCVLLAKNIGPHLLVWDFFIKISYTKIAEHLALSKY